MKNPVSKTIDNRAEYYAKVNDSYLNSLMIELSKYGRPNLHCSSDKTWSSSLEISFNFDGLEGTIRSGFNHPTPYAAIKALIQKLKDIAASPQARQEYQVFHQIEENAYKHGE